MSSVRRVITVDDERLAQRCAQGRVVLIDDDGEILQALQALLEFEGFAVEAYGSAYAYLAALAEDRPQFPGPQCVLCDVNMPATSGLELQQTLLQRRDIPFLLMSGVSGAHEVVSGFRAGAVDFLIKPVLADTLLAAVRRALDISQRTQTEQAQAQALSARSGSLSERERAVVRLVATGMTNQAIAQALGIALRTVKLHRQRGMHKLGATSTADLVRLVDSLEP